MRGFKKSESLTRDAYASGKLIDSKHRSFVSQPKLIPGENTVPEPHWILYGSDATAARMKLFLRRNSKCEECGCVVTWDGELFFAGQLHHIRNKAWERCWCPVNLRLLCFHCHDGKHSDRRPRWGAGQDVRLMPGGEK